MSGAMRDRMPLCAAFVDELRAAFGADEITSVIKRGLRPDCRPEQRVWFSERGHTLGQPLPEPMQAVSAAQMVIGEQPVISMKRGRK